MRIKDEVLETIILRDGPMDISALLAKVNNTFTHYSTPLTYTDLIWMVSDGSLVFQGANIAIPDSRIVVYYADSVYDGGRRDLVAATSPWLPASYFKVSQNYFAYYGKSESGFGITKDPHDRIVAMSKPGCMATIHLSQDNLITYRYDVAGFRHAPRPPHD